MYSISFIVYRDIIQKKQLKRKQLIVKVLLVIVPN